MTLALPMAASWRHFSVALTAAALGCALASPAFSHGKKKHNKHNGEEATVAEVISFDVYRQPSGIIDVLSVKSNPGHKPTFFHSRSINDGKSFSPRVSITSRLKDGQKLGDMRTPKRGGDFQIASSGKTILISYEIKGNNKYGSGPLRTLISTDGGLSFENYKNISDSTLGQGFVDIAATKSGTFHWVWLENHPDGRGLRHAVMDMGSTSLTAVENHVDKKTCACCWNTVKAVGDDLYVIYRNKKPSDMTMMYSKDRGKTWQDGGVVGAFGWDFDGCPHVGSSLAFDPGAKKGLGTKGRPFAHATAWTAKEGKLGLYYQNWPGTGSQWTAPYLLAENGRRGDIATIDNMVVAVYEEMIDEKNVARIRVADITRKPLTFSKARTISTNFTFYPRLEATKDGVIMFTNQSVNGVNELVIDRISPKTLKKMLKSIPESSGTTTAAIPSQPKAKL